MESGTCNATISARVQAIELVLDLIAREGRGCDLHDLRVVLIDIMGLLRRDPGIEMAVDDLYAAASVVVRECSAGSKPAQRNLRLLKDARERFCGRLRYVAAQAGVEERPRYHGLEAVYAVQLERSLVTWEVFPARLAG